MNKKKVVIEEIGISYEEKQDWKAWIVLAWRFQDGGKTMNTISNIVIQTAGGEEEAEEFARKKVEEFGPGWSCKAIDLMALLDNLNATLNVDMLVDNLFSPK